MELDAMLDGLLESHAVATNSDGDKVVALRLGGDWGAGFRLHRQGTHRQWNVREVTLRLLDAGSTINGNDVRDLPLGSMLAEARRLATKSAALDVPVTRKVDLGRVLADTGGVFGSGDDALAALAFEYVSLVEGGNRAPSKALAERFGGSPGTWTNRVSAARKRGFLTPVGRGEAGGALTLQARTVLRLEDNRTGT